MRVDVRLEADGPQAWRLTAAYAGETLGPIRVSRVDEAPWVAPPEGGGHEPVEEIRAVVARIQKQEGIEDGDGRRLGRYLYASLFEHIWDPVAAAAGAADEALVEFALHFPDEPGLHGVPWELAHDDTCFVTTSKTLVVALTRCIESPAEERQLPAPARVLFAIGTDMLSENVRAGAEFMGLMRDLGDPDHSIVPLIVDEASVDSLAEAVERFKPDVVHVISHGEVTDGKAMLHMRPSEPDGGEDPALVDGETLLTALRSSQGLPAIVVLSACEGGAARSSNSVPLAQELVAAGVPAVIAMSGSVSDAACRLFTRRFGSVLVRGGALVRASAEGRWAAFRNGEPPSRSVDWALPVLFLADGLPHDYEPLRTATDTGHQRRMHNYELPETPVFCGRRRFLRVYDELLPRNRRSALSTVVIYTTGGRKGVGKTRLLRQFAEQALRDGHVPCLLPVKDAPTRERPSSLDDLAEQLLWGIVDARKRCGFQQLTASKLLGLLAPDADPRLAEYPGDERELEIGRVLGAHRGTVRITDGKLLKAAAALDFARLRETAMASGDPVYSDATRVLVLLDGIDAWNMLLDDLFDSILVGREGFGQTAECPVPVVATCAREVLHAELLAEIDETTRSSRNHIRLMELGPLEAGDEDTLAFQWILLNPDPTISKKVYAAEPSTDWDELFRLLTDGIPSKLGTAKFFKLAEYQRGEGKLQEGDDLGVIKQHFASPSTGNGDGP